MKRPFGLVPLLAVGCLSLGAYVDAGRQTPPRKPNAQLLFNGWGLSPAGVHVSIGDMPIKLVKSPDGKQLVTGTIGFSGVHLTTLDAATGSQIQSVELERVFNGLAFSPDGKTLYVGGGNSGKVFVFSYDGGRLTKRAEVKGPEGSFAAGIAVHPVTGDVYLCDEARNQVYRLDPTTLEIKGSVMTGSNPYACAFGEDARYLYVSNWGSMSVSVIDVETPAHVRDIRVGVRPNDMAVAPDGRLFVSCAGDNTVHVIQTRAPEQSQGGPTRAMRLPEGVREILNTSIEPTPLEGSSPVGVAVSPDGKALVVANADNNDVMVADVSDAKETVIKGFVPTGWYPTSLAAANDRVFIACGKGLHSRANYPGKKDTDKGRQGQPYDYIGNTFEGAVSTVKTGDDAQLAKWTDQVRRNTPFQSANVMTTGAKRSSVIPTKVGDPCPIKHVLYVIMENRTYDQVFGDLKIGNGDPYLCMYGDKVTPNRHKLARDYVLLDNFYCNGEVSYDGHSWCDAAIATDEMQKQWTSGYSNHGDVTNGEALQAPTAGYIWNLARRHGLRVKAYGEGADSYLGGNAVPVDCRGTWRGDRDMDRVDGWIKDLHDGEKRGNLANFMIMSLGEDHTAGTTPGWFTPEACVGSNDQAIGKIVAAASRSPLWKSMALFFVEDDAQDGPDHVDAHRTFAMVVSPYVKRQTVDGTMYSQVGMVRTMELILSLPPMTQYDAAAMPMFNSFASRAAITPYELQKPLIDLMAKNPANAPGAAASQAMDFSGYDRAPADALNRILWAAAKGPDIPYPAIRRSFAHR